MRKTIVSGLIVLSGLIPEKSPARYRARAVLGLRPHFVPSGGPKKPGPMASTTYAAAFFFPLPFPCDPSYHCGSFSM